MPKTKNSITEQFIEDTKPKPKYKIGITEQGDAGIDLSWVNQLKKVDAAILITKEVTEGFIREVLKNKDKLIVHSTITGYGSTLIEPNVSERSKALGMTTKLVNEGFPIDKVVIRVDPIIPTEKGIKQAETVIRSAISDNYKRFRISIIDMYQHVRERFIGRGISLPYGNYRMMPDNAQSKAVDDMIENLQKEFPDIRIECCAEPQLKNPIQCGCISSYDLKLFGLKEEDNTLYNGYQREKCMCYAGKKELLNHKVMCDHQCLYCYWKSER